MYPPDAAQQVVVRRLNAQRNAVEPRLPQRAQGLPVAGAVGVGLQCDLRVGGHMEPLFHGFQQVRQPLLPQIAGGAAAEIHGVHRVGGRQGGRLRQVGGTAGRHLLQMAQQRGGVGVHFLLAVGQGVEITVGALAFAEGDVQIQTQCLLHDVSCPPSAFVGSW